jgi:general secretion pathway protein C
MAEKSNPPRPAWEKYLPYLLFLFLGFCVADLVILNYRDLMIPTQPPPAKIKSSKAFQPLAFGYFNSIVTRNIFSSTGEIPDALLPAGVDPNKAREELPPVPSNLPLALEGTIVHSNPEKSIANINVKSKNQIIPYVKGRDIEGLATLVTVERKKIILRNSNNGMLEFIEMKDASSKISFQGSKTGPTAPTEVKQVAQNKFQIKRAVLEEKLKDLGSILQQAAMVPVKNPDGSIRCYKFLAVQPGSIYTQLDMQKGDCIDTVNGEKIDSPAKAMELYQTLRTSNNVIIGRERDGRKEDVNFDIQ